MIFTRLGPRTNGDTSKFYSNVWFIATVFETQGCIKYRSYSYIFE